MNDFKHRLMTEQDEWLQSEFTELYRLMLTKARNRPHDRNTPHMMTVKELSEATGVSQYAIRKMCKANEIPHVNAGVKILINKETFIDHLKGNI